MTTGNQPTRLMIETKPRGFEAAGGPAAWVAAPLPPRPAAHPWDEAHRAVRDPARLGFEAAGGPPDYAEPDFEQAFPFPRPDAGGLESFRGDPCADRGPDDFWPVAAPAQGWHLDAGHSQLGAARDRVGSAPAAEVVVAHLDTGYDPDHPTRPTNFHPERGRNFAGGDPADCTDPGRFAWNTQPGHGTATVALLASTQYGGAPFAAVVPVRIADSVVHFRTSSMAAGLEHAASIGAWVVSVSMGGVPSRAWAAAVNRCYEAGVAIFAAAGNRFGPSPPATMVWPARFGRVTAVCGATADGTPYYKDRFHTHMQGCFGPPGAMAHALAAYTPNAPWALMGCPIVGFGGGTSSATPQAAAAAALWLAAHPAPAGTAPWQRVEAVRHALFHLADRSHPQAATYYGSGVLKAAAALDLSFDRTLQPAPADDVWFPWVRLAGGFEAAAAPTGVERMYEVEALQAFLLTPGLQELAGGADPLADPLPPADRRRLLDAMRRSPRVSEALRQRLDQVLRGIGA